ncbi:hypothetical protein PR048_008529 [Dryococelus australis]|uniref:Uncharacterized protein n=1 Tax=Dryococelus australis TaxID=614101 RepID=A0ABQ9HXC7_9NEOP|nr:hypothetical protein PR048_008529 [Dryococelus australis]
MKVIAFEVAEASGREHFFNTEKKCASKKRWANFIQRYGLTLRVPEKLSVYRMSMANSTMVDDYFDKLTDTMARLNIQHKPQSGDRNTKGVHLQKKLWRTWGNYDICRLHMCQWDLDTILHNLQRCSLECGFQNQSSPANAILKVPTPRPRLAQKNSRASTSRSAILITSRPMPDPVVTKPQHSSEKLCERKNTFGASSAGPLGTGKSASHDQDWTCGSCS